MACFPPDSPSLPALDWQLPSSSGPYSLQIEVQPKSHHRAHYETEGSRGAVKALAGGHPVVQVCQNCCFKVVSCCMFLQALGAKSDAFYIFRGK